MKLIKGIGAQGDVLFVKVAKVPAKAVKQARSGAIVVAHSETGHHHVVEEPTSDYFEVPGDPLVGYLQLGDGTAELGGADVVHLRGWDTHEPQRLLGKPGDVYEIHRQREGGLESWRRVAD